MKGLKMKQQCGNCRYWKFTEIRHDLAFGDCKWVGIIPFYVHISKLDRVSLAEQLAQDCPAFEPKGKR